MPEPIVNIASERHFLHAFETALQLQRANVLFVPMPVLNNTDLFRLLNQAQDRLKMIDHEAKRQKGGK